METLLLLAFGRGLPRSPVGSPHKGLWGGAFKFSLICAWTIGRANNREAGDLKRKSAHYDVTLMFNFSHNGHYLSSKREYPLLNEPCKKQYINTLRPRQNGRHFSDDIFKCIFLNQNAWISLKISLKFVPRVRINNIPALVEIMAWRRPGDKPLSEPMMVSLLTHICVIRPQWVKSTSCKIFRITGPKCEKVPAGESKYRTWCYFPKYQRL